MKISLTGTVQEFKQIKKFTHKGKTLKKRVINFALNKKENIFVELREKEIDKIAFLNIKEGDEIRLQIQFLGSQKDGKYYNNIVASSVAMPWEKFPGEEK